MKLGEGWYIPNIKQLEDVGMNLSFNFDFWSITEGYGLYAWYYNSSIKYSSYCLRDKELKTIAFKNK
jgi:hypothetical protein